MKLTNDDFVRIGKAAYLGAMRKVIDSLESDWRDMMVEAKATPIDARGGWGKMTREERSIEMKRRLSMRTAPAIEAPKHLAQSTGAKTRWAKMSKKKRADWLVKMQAGRAKQQKAKRANEEKKLTLSERLKLHPRDPRSPKHDEWKTTISKGRRAQIDKMPTVRMQKLNGQEAVQ